MEIRFENQENFSVCGYVVETDLENNETDLGELWLKYENKLREIPESNSCLYGIMWYTDETHSRYCYLLGIGMSEHANLTDMQCVEIPKGYFAVAKVPKEMSAVEAWTEFFFKDIPASGHVPDEKHGIYFEFHDENGNCEFWTPVKPIKE